MGFRRNKDIRPAVSETALELANIVEQRLGQLTLDQGDVATGLDKIVEELTDEGRTALLLQLFEKMSPEEQYGMLANTFDNAELREALDEKNRIATENATRQIAMEGLRADAQGTHRLELGNLFPGSTIQLNLHITDDFKRAGNAKQLYNGHTSPDWRLCFTQADESAFRVLESQLTQFDGHKERVPQIGLDLHDVVTLGVPNSTRSRLEPTLFWGAPVWMDRRGDLNPITITAGELALGDILVNSKSIFR